MKVLYQSLALSLPVLVAAQSSSCSPPTVDVKNGSYVGVYQPTYGQDLFLGIPFAQPPLGDLRLALPQSLNETWSDARNATAYYPECVGYGGDDVGYDVSEDCLALNVIRPAGYEGQNLPVGVWIHGGGYVMGGTPDRRYNLSFIVQNSVAIGKPIIGVSIAYRLSGWGFLDSQEIRDAGVTNLGMRDQRLALQWIQENIDAFGGNPKKVTIWGESAGAGSVGIHLIAYGGRDDGLFSGAIGESGNPILLGPKYNVSVGQAIFDNITEATGCSNSSNGALSCLRSLSYDDLNTALNITPSYDFYPYNDDDFIQGSQYDQLVNGSFIKVPYLLGTNADEGSAFGQPGINNDTDFDAYLHTLDGLDDESIRTLEVVYPNIPALTDVLYGLNYTPNATYGSQWKRAVAIGGDYAMIAPRRLTCEQWAAHNASIFCYRFNAYVHGLTTLYGATHFQEVAFVFNNVNGLGYADNPFMDEPASYYQLSKLMSYMWAAFIHDGDPNGHGMVGYDTWPKYDNGLGGEGQDYFFDTKVKSAPEPDTYRGVGIAYMNTLWKSKFGK